MRSKKRTGRGCNPEPARRKEVLSKNTVSRLTLFGQGLMVQGSPCNIKGGTPPKRQPGDVKGWSPASARRMRETLMTHRPPGGWTCYSQTLTIPALPAGSQTPCVDLATARAIWHRFQIWLNERGHVVVWRLEIQPRDRTTRADIRGIAQPHWHIIGACPPGVGDAPARPTASGDVLAEVSRAWLRCIGDDRASVRGAEDRAAVGELCSGWREAQIRYLFDHSTKRKASQVAEGWGRHWGVIGRARFVREQGIEVWLTQPQEASLVRILRRLHARRIPDRRAMGGIPWQCIEVEVQGSGSKLSWMGGGMWVEGWTDYPALPPLAARRAIARALGIQKRNIWAMRIRRSRRPLAGQWFGGLGVRQALHAVGARFFTGTGAGRAENLSSAVVKGDLLGQGVETPTINRHPEGAGVPGKGCQTVHACPTT